MEWDEGGIRDVPGEKEMVYLRAHPGKKFHRDDVMYWKPDRVYLSNEFLNTHTLPLNQGAKNYMHAKFKYLLGENNDD